MRYLLTLTVVAIMLYFAVDSAMQLANGINKRVDILNSALKGS